MFETRIRAYPTMCVLAALLTGAAAFGQASSTPADAGETVYKLSLREALTTALANNLDLEIAKKDPMVAEQGIEQQKSAFDPGLFASASHSESKQEISNLFSLNESKRDGYAAGVSQTLPFGADYTATLSAGRQEASGPLVSVPSSYGADLNLQFNMPLLKGYGTEATTEQLVLARGNLDVSRQDLRQQAQQTLQTVEGAYWDVVAAREGLRIARLRLQRAQDLLDLNRKKVEVGTLAPIEITQAEAGVASQEEGVIVADFDLRSAEDELRRLLAVPADDPMWNERIEATDQPSYAPVSIDLEAAITEAYERRPELAGARQTVRNRLLSERVAKRELRPSLNLAVQVDPEGNNFSTTIDPGPDGIPGTTDDVSLTVTNDAYVEAIREIPKFNNYSWSVGLNFRYALGNRQAKADYATASIRREQAELSVTNLEQSVRVEVRRSARAIESGVKQVEAARANVVLQRKKLEAEQKKFENGMSTSFEVLTFQNDLADAELSEVQAVIQFMKSRAALEAAKGTLLESRGLTL